MEGLSEHFEVGQLLNLSSACAPDGFYFFLAFLFIQLQRHEPAHQFLSYSRNTLLAPLDLFSPCLSLLSTHALVFCFCVLRHSLYWKWKQRIVSIPAILREFFFPFCPIHNALQSVLSVFALKWLNNLLALIEFSLWTLNPLAFWQCCLLFLLFHHCNCSCRGWLVVTGVSFGCSPFSNVGFDPNRVSPGWE